MYTSVTKGKPTKRGMPIDTERPLPLHTPGSKQNKCSTAENKRERESESERGRQQQQQNAGRAASARRQSNPRCVRVLRCYFNQHPLGLPVHLEQFPHPAELLAQQLCS